MLVPDLTFHFLLGMAELLAIAFCLTQRQRLRPLTLLLALLLLFPTLVFLAAMFVNELFGFRLFGFLRFVGLAAAIHLPLLLLAFATFDRGERGPRWLSAALALVLLAGATYAWHIEPYRLEVTRYSITSPRLEGLERPVQILQVADIQTDRIGDYERSLIEEMKRLNPDFVVYLGDYLQIVDSERRAEVAVEFNRLLREAELHPPLGSYAVQGDTDRWTGWEELFAGTGIEPLRNEVREVELPGVAVNLVALDPWHSRARSPEPLRAIAAAGRPGAFEIFAGHSPDFSDQLAAEDQPFLALAGHTHGGQVRLPFFGAPITYSRLPRAMVAAFQRFGPGVLSVSRGIGMERHEAPRVRFLCRPELRVVTLLPPGGESPAVPGKIHIPDPGYHAAAE